LPKLDRPEEEAEAEQPYLLIRASRLRSLRCVAARPSGSDKRPLDDVLTSLGLRHVRGFSLRFRLHTALSPFDTFQRLEPFATRHVQQGTDHLLVFDLSTDDHTLPANLLAEFNGSLNLFEELDRLQNLALSGQPTLQQVSLFLEREAPPASEAGTQESDTISPLFLLDWLSDGEQSFLAEWPFLQC